MAAKDERGSGPICTVQRSVQHQLYTWGWSVGSSLPHLPNLSERHPLRCCRHIADGFFSQGRDESTIAKVTAPVCIARAPVIRIAFWQWNSSASLCRQCSAAICLDGCLTVEDAVPHVPASEMPNYHDADHAEHQQLPERLELQRLTCNRCLRGGGGGGGSRCAAGVAVRGAQRRVNG